MFVVVVVTFLTSIALRFLPGGNDIIVGLKAGPGATKEQAQAVIKELGLDPSKINPLGGAIALGHPLGATGAIRTATIVHGMQRTGGKYGMVSMCIGTGMGAAGIFERV